MSDSANDAIPKETFEKNEIIFRKGDPANFLYIIETGKVEIYLEEYGLSKSLATIKKSSMFGEMALIDDKPRSANARATKKTTCYMIHRNDIQSRMDMLDPFMKSVFKVLVDTIRDKNQHY